MSNVQWDGEMDDWYSDGYEAEKEAARSEKRTVVLDLEYNPDEAEDIEQWLNADRITDSIWGDDHTHFKVTWAQVVPKDQCVVVDAILIQAMKNAQADAWNLAIAQAVQYLNATVKGEQPRLPSNPFLPHISTYPDPT